MSVFLGTEVVLGLDAGTSSAKALAVDRSGRVRAEAGSDPIATRTTPDGGSEQDPEAIWRALIAAARRVVKHLRPDTRVAALALAAQSGSVIPVSVDGRAEQAITWMDTRSRPLVANWPPAVTDRIRVVSGWTATAGVGLSTIAWLQDRQGSVARWAAADDYLVFRLTGGWATNPSNAAGMQLMEVSTRNWSDELCGLAAVDPSMLSPIRESGAVAGGLTGEAADDLGLDAGTPVVVGGHDQACAALGLGVVDPGDVFLSAGTAWVLTAVTDRADVGALPSALNLSPHVLPGLWTASENLGGLGAMLAETPQSEARDRFETCALRVSQALEAADELAAGGSGLTLVGGGTRSSGLVEAVAAAIDRPVITRPEASWPALGAARLAAAALGWTHQGEAT